MLLAFTAAALSSIRLLRRGLRRRTLVGTALISESIVGRMRALCRVSRAVLYRLPVSEILVSILADRCSLQVRTCPVRDGTWKHAWKVLRKRTDLSVRTSRRYRWTRRPRWRCVSCRFIIRRMLFVRVSRSLLLQPPMLEEATLPTSMCRLRCRARDAPTASDRMPLNSSYRLLSICRGASSVARPCCMRSEVTIRKKFLSRPPAPFRITPSATLSSRNRLTLQAVDARPGRQTRCTVLPLRVPAS